MSGEVRQLAPGDMFAGCRIESLAGRGGMGLVYRARQMRPNRMVAVKVINPDVVAGDSELYVRFEQEASLAAQIDHPNVIPIYGVDEEDGLLYIIMRFVESTDLGELLRAHGRLAPGHAARCVTQIAAALDAAHALGLVHRDVKPANVLVAGAGPDEHLYLTDFGLARRISDFGGGPTRLGDFVGTLDYSAPEQILGVEVDARTDVYALGAMLHELLTGVVPFPRDQASQKYFAHLSLPPPRPSDRVPTLLTELDPVVVRAMAKDPADRFQSAGELARAATYAARPAELRSSPASPRTVPSSPPPQPPPPPLTGSIEDPGRPIDEDETRDHLRPVIARSPRSRRQMAAGLVTVLIVLSALTVVIFSRRTPPTSIISQYAIDHASDPVTYCTGGDSVTSKDGHTTQHAQSVSNFNTIPQNNVHATLLPFSNDASQQYQQFSRDRRDTRRCDVFYSDVTWTADFAHNKWLVDLSPYFRGRLGNFVPAMQAAAVFEGKVYGVPKQADAGLLYYRKDLSTAPRTWQELYRRAAPNELLRYQGQDYEGLTVAFLELAYAAGAQPIVAPNHKADLNQPQARLALQLMVDGIRKHAVPREVVDQKEGSSLYAFGTGRADFMRNWSPTYAALQDRRAYPKVAGHVGVAPLPAWDNLPPASVLGGHVLVVSASTKHLAAALKLVEYLSSQEVITQDAVNFSLAPAIASLWNDARVKSALPASGDLRKAVFSAKSRPVTPNYQAVSEAISKNVNSALRGETQPSVALDTANYDMQQALDAAYAPGH